MTSPYTCRHLSDRLDKTNEELQRSKQREGALAGENRDLKSSLASVRSMAEQKMDMALRLEQSLLKLHGDLKVIAPTAPVAFGTSATSTCPPQCLIMPEHLQRSRTVAPSNRCPALHHDYSPRALSLQKQEVQLKQDKERFAKQIAESAAELQRREHRIHRLVPSRDASFTGASPLFRVGHPWSSLAYCWSMRFGVVCDSHYSCL